MNFQQLRYVREAIRSDLNLTEASQALNTSQSGVSKQIRECCSIAFILRILLDTTRLKHAERSVCCDRFEISREKHGPQRPAAAIETRHHKARRIAARASASLARRWTAHTGPVTPMRRRARGPTCG